MSSLSGVRSFSASVSQVLLQGSQQAAREIQQNADRLDKRKENISQSALTQIQNAQQTTAKLAEARNKIDTFV